MAGTADAPILFELMSVNNLDFDDYLLLQVRVILGLQESSLMRTWLKDSCVMEYAMIEYCKVGEMEMARKLFDRLGSAINWNTMISGHLHQREFGITISMFQ